MNRKDILNYFDILGTSFKFYTQGKRKLYTSLGGFLSLLIIIIIIFLFIILNLSEFKKKNPISSMWNIYLNEFNKIKLKEEKIYLVWRIEDSESNIFNHKGLLYPIIYYYYKEIAENQKIQDIKTKKLNYKLCNETSMNKIVNDYYIETPLNELYCVDLDDIILDGKSNNSYIKFDLDLCNDNSKCDNNSDIIGGNENIESLNFVIYFPTISFKSNNELNPIYSIFKNQKYNLTKYLTKINELYFQRFIFNLDSSLFISNKKNSTYWGINKLTKNIDFIPIVNNFSTKLFSLTYYFDSEIIYYERSYKKFYTILKDSLPIIHIIFIILYQIAKIIKLSFANKKYTELLFEDMVFSKGILCYNPNNANNIKNKNKTKKNTFNFNIKYNMRLPSIVNLINTKNKRINTNSTLFNLTKNNINKSNVPLINKSFFIKDIKYKQTKEDYNKQIQTEPFPRMNLIRPKRVLTSDIYGFMKYNRRNRFLDNSKYYSDGPGVKEDIIPITIEDLFPFRYYCLWLFIKNIKLNEINCCFSRKFVMFYNFMTQKFDLSYYFLLQKEFSLLRGKVLEIYNSKLGT